MKVGLFVGRFQPFHNGHLDVIVRALKQVDVLKIVIGSAQYSKTWYNPFSSYERNDMILSTLEKMNIADKVIITCLDDIEDPVSWPEYIVDNVGNFDILFSNNVDGVIKLFKQRMPEKCITMFGNGLGNRCATDIRKMIVHNDADWQMYVPETVKEFLIKNKGCERLINIYTNKKEKEDEMR